MKEVPIKEIEDEVEDCVKNHKKWHFHILTPACKLNTQQKYALVFENTDDNETLVSYSQEPKLLQDKEFAKKLHGDKVLDGKSETSEPSSGGQKILERIKELNSAGKPWHHHMFFPDCMFNENKGKWTIIFEDSERGLLLEATSEEEPKQDLRHIEVLFYQQKKIK
ncbi:hypothetical protein A3G67_02665 [Candidatus Roizmanbacteria bacterium RIFCSPLOWO2_12_FULL_40_12]|nr:MAG: hypothetical protein A3G67_02665 [Candidatus Roizmanbacteria bacterium RIFCSPLOWO2_12_FULL_40_12]